MNHIQYQYDTGSFRWSSNKMIITEGQFPGFEDDFQIHTSMLHPQSLTAHPWKMVVGRRSPFLLGFGNCSGGFNCHVKLLGVEKLPDSMGMQAGAVLVKLYKCGVFVFSCFHLVSANYGFPGSLLVHIFHQGSSVDCDNSSTAKNNIKGAMTTAIIGPTLSQLQIAHRSFWQKHVGVDTCSLGTRFTLKIRVGIFCWCLFDQGKWASKTACFWRSTFWIDLWNLNRLLILSFKTTESVGFHLHLASYFRTTPLEITNKTPWMC